MGVVLAYYQIEFKGEYMNSAKTKRVTKDWSAIASEPVSVEIIKGKLFAFGSELACLRLFKAFMGKARCEYSKNLKTWVFNTV